ncbi:hypothetical protein HYV31_01595 [candidate division WWE3 bacterium]|nr:hypothetical protein [candidate division WWE3 bacterium]
MTPYSFLLPKKYTAKLLKKDQLNQRVVEIILEVISPPDFKFISGQFVSLSVGKGIFRSYSIASSKSKASKISLLVENAHDGAGSNFINGLSIGDTVEFIGPSGRFCLPTPLNKNLVFVVTGTGIAPILSMLEELSLNKCKLELTLYFGIRNTQELLKIDLLEDYTKRLEHFDYKLCYSSTPTVNEIKNPRILTGRVTKNVEVKDALNTLFVLCGHPLMIMDMAQILIEKGVPRENILHEKFTVAKKV